MRGIRALTSRKKGSSPIIAAVYSAFRPRLNQPCESGDEAAAITSGSVAARRISAGTSLKLFGTRSHWPR